MRTVGKGGPGIPLGPDGRAPDVQDEKRVGKFPALWWVMWKGVGSIFRGKLQLRFF